MTYAFAFAQPPKPAAGMAERAREAINPRRRFDVTRPFLPEALARTAALDFLSADERLALNQIRGNAYLTIMGALERVARGVWRNCAADLAPERPASGACVAVANGSSQVFAAFREAFTDALGAPGERTGLEAAMASHLGRCPPLAAALLALHVAWMAQRHVKAARLNAQSLDPCFRDMIFYRGIDMDGHTEPGARLVRDLAARSTPAERDTALGAYRSFCHLLSETLREQALLDLDALARACERPLSADERLHTLAIQNHANWWTYVGCGLTHPRFLEAIQSVKPGALAEFEAVAALG